MRLIDADALKERAIRVSTAKDHCYMKAVGTHEIDKAPTIDAMEVVRCKDCKYWDKATIRKGFLICPASGMEIMADDYCSYGKRKENT